MGTKCDKNGKRLELAFNSGVEKMVFKVLVFMAFIARQHTDARY